MEWLEYKQHIMYNVYRRNRLFGIDPQTDGIVKKNDTMLNIERINNCLQSKIIFNRSIYILDHLYGSSSFFFCKLSHPFFSDN